MAAVANGLVGLTDPADVTDTAGSSSARVLAGSDGSAGAGLRICLLGGFRVWAGGREIEPGAWRVRKARSLVKLLALAPGHQLHREQITDLLWPEAEPAAAASNFRYTLHIARRVLAAGAPAAAPLPFEENVLALCTGAPPWIDVAAFEAGAAAARRRRDPGAYQSTIALYSGELLPEDRYEDWVIVQREALHALQLALSLELAALYESQGEYEPALDALQRVVAYEPAHEDAHVALMRLHAQCGRRAQALHQYR
ncbi:MAG: hypothetical protein HY332_10400 [Chloroflexi bacterium]|nr:hypothetical protein [Chloroflexota bacterium]